MPGRPRSNTPEDVETVSRQHGTHCCDRRQNIANNTANTATINESDTNAIVRPTGTSSSRNVCQRPGGCTTMFELVQLLGRLEHNHEAMIFTWRNLEEVDHGSRYRESGRWLPTNM
eukprot:365725-Chlamydomonas_euryale.AAC.42